MKQLFKSYLILLFIGLFSFSTAGAQEDTLIDFDDLEFTEGVDVQAQEQEGELIEIPDDLEFGDGEEVISENQNTNEDALLEAADDSEESASLWTIFIAGILGGFAAFVMPCIFPMVPLTVSFFTKQSGSKAKAVSQALLYGLFIIVIYVALGML